MIPLWLTFIVLATALFAVGGLVTTIWSAMRFGQRRRFAPAAGSEWHGMQYALIGGMMPWAKESVRSHLLTWCAGIVYHLGIAAGFCVLLLLMLSAEVGVGLRLVLQILSIAGGLAGIGLLVKRAATLALRAISTPDDIISNGLVILFVLKAALVLSFPQTSLTFAIVASLLLLYIPLGKIRHCVLFFLSRITFGRFFGRRGVLPHRQVEAKESHVG